MESAPDLDDFARAVRAGLTEPPRRLPCRFFYDAEGSRLFEAICATPEYYLTRAEDRILARHAGEIAARVPGCVEVVELGSGSARQTRRVLRAVLDRRSPGFRLRYVPIDVSRAALEDCARALRAEFETLEVEPQAGEYAAIERVLARRPAGPRLVLWLGSNVGNLDRTSAAEFLSGVRAGLAAGDRILLGVDRRKSPAVLVRAYDDAQGVTARFNQNVLMRANRDLGADFDAANFRHVARWDEPAGRIEMHLESTLDQRVSIRALGLEIELARGERIHTEDSYKYSDSEIADLARRARCRVERVFHDDDAYFASVLLEPA